MLSDVPPLQGSDLWLNPTQGFTLGYSLSPFQGSGGRFLSSKVGWDLGRPFRALETVPFRV